MSYDRTFGADRHDLGSRLIPAAEGATKTLARRAVDAVRRVLGRTPEERGNGAALSRIAGGAARGPGADTHS